MIKKRQKKMERMRKSIRKGGEISKTEKRCTKRKRREKKHEENVKI